MVAGEGEGGIVKGVGLDERAIQVDAERRQGGDVECERAGWAKVSFLTSKPIDRIKIASYGTGCGIEPDRGIHRASCLGDQRHYQLFWKYLTQLSEDRHILNFRKRTESAPMLSAQMKRTGLERRAAGTRAEAKNAVVQHRA